MSSAPRPRTAARDVAVRYGVVATLVLLVAYLSLSAPAFASLTNWTALVRDMAVAAIIALAVTVSVVVNGFDVSVGANAGFTVILSMIAMVMWGWPLWAAVPLALASGALIGLVNAALIVRLRLPDLLATLGTLFVLSGAQQILAGGQTISAGMSLPDGTVAPGTVSPAFATLSGGSVLGVPAPILLTAALALALWFLLTRTRWGRVLYAVGSNPEAARLSGVNVGAYRTLAYVLSGTLASVAGLLLASRLGIGVLAAGDSYMLSGVAATMIGFAVMGSGRANVVGTLVGALMMAVIANGFTMLNVPFYTQNTIFGLLMLAALSLSFVVRRR